MPAERDPRLSNSNHGNTSKTIKMTTQTCQPNSPAKIGHNQDISTRWYRRNSHLSSHSLWRPEWPDRTVSATTRKNRAVSSDTARHFLENWKKVGTFERFERFLNFFLKELKKNYEKTGFSRKSGPNLISFAFNRGGRVKRNLDSY